MKNLFLGLFAIAVVLSTFFGFQAYHDSQEISYYQYSDLNQKMYEVQRYVDPRQHFEDAIKDKVITNAELSKILRALEKRVMEERVAEIKDVNS